MRIRTDKLRIIYLVVLILFISAVGFFMMDNLGLINIGRLSSDIKNDILVTEALGDEPSLIEKEEFEKEKQKLLERIEELDKREALLLEKERELNSEMQKIAEMQKGIELEKQKLKDERSIYAGYEKNVKVLADKMANMPPDESVKIMINWEEPLIIDVLRQMDADAATVGRMSITPYLITLMPKEKASRIMYLMTQI